MLLNICICIIVFLLGLNLKNLIGGFSKDDKYILTFLFFYHFIIAISFHFYLIQNGGDAIKYWNLPQAGTFDDIIYLIVNRKASSFMYLINYFPSTVLKLSMFTGNMIYALLGYLGFIYLYKLIQALLPEKSVLKSIKILGIRLFPLILFLPNLHFWSSGIGKDAILFFCVIAFVYSLYFIKKRWKLFIISIILSLAIRPHITLFLAVGFGIAFLIDKRLKFYKKLIIFFILILGLISIFDYVIQFIQLESLEISSIQDYTDSRISDLSSDDTDSGIDLSSYPYIIKVFTFLYRPLFFDLLSPLAILASVENLILIIFTIQIVRNKIFLGLIESNYFLKGMLFYFILGTMTFSLILSNLGIILRQKNMFIPLFLVFGLWILYKSKIKKQHLSNATTSSNK